MHAAFLRLCAEHSCKYVSKVSFTQCLPRLLVASSALSRHCSVQFRVISLVCVFSACKLRNRCPQMLCFHSDPHRDGLACLKHFTRSRSVDCCVTLHKGLPVLTALLTLVSEPQCRVTLDLNPGQMP